MRKTLIAAAIVGAFSVPTFAVAADAPAAAPAPEHTFTGNITLATDYRFRGISQTWKQPTIQGGFDYSHASGFYLGNWNSNVSGNSYNNGASLEMDFYGGYKFEVVKDVTLDLGALQYYYPGAKLNSAPGVATDKKYDNTELYVGVTYGAFSGKLSYAVTDYFGLNQDTAGYAYFSALTPNGGSKGTTYLDLNYSMDLGSGLTLGLHVGKLSVRHYGDLNYTDYKIGLTKDLSGWALGAAIVGTNAKKDFYQIGNSAWTDAKEVGKATLVLSLGKTF